MASINFVKFLRTRAKNAKVVYKAESYGANPIEPVETVTFSEQFDTLDDAREWLLAQEKASGHKHTGNSTPNADSLESINLLKWLKARFDYNKTE